MKLQKNNRRSLRKPAVLMAVIAFLVLVFVILEKTHVTDFIKTHPSNTSQGPNAEQQKQDAEANAAKKKDLIEDKSGSTTPAATPSTATSIDLSARQETNNTVTVFTKLYGYSSGNCELTVTNGSKTTTQTAAAIYQPEYASCAGFSVPIDPLGKGTWSIKLTVTSDTSQVKTILFEVK